MALVNLNNMNDQKIILDVKNLTVQFKTPHGVVKAVNNISFDLKKGETLGYLGQKYYGEAYNGAQKIMKLNKLKSDIIHPGQKLRVK